MHSKQTKNQLNKVQVELQQQQQQQQHILTCTKQCEWRRQEMPSGKDHYGREHF